MGEEKKSNASSMQPRKGIADVHLTEVRSLLSLQKLVEDLVPDPDAHNQNEPDPEIQQQYRKELREKLKRMPAKEIAYILEALEPNERLVVWDEVKEGADPILALLSDDVLEELIDDSHYRNEKTVITAFELREGKLRQIQVHAPEDLKDVHPIWVDLIAPTKKMRAWIGEMFDVEVPDPSSLTDLEASARFYVEDDGEVHLHSDFLLDTRDESRNVPVALILHNEILFTVRTEELPVFRLQRARARTRPGYVSDGKDVLLDLYAADVEYSANALEDVYGELEKVGTQVLQSHITDVEASQILAGIAEAEDLNGRTRRSVLDTRRALSFLMRGKLLSDAQHADVREILRDIESLDGHTAFLFNKINFLLDATDSGININANKKIERLTIMTVTFMPINILAGIGGMSEFSDMAKTMEWSLPATYGAFFAAIPVVSGITYLCLRLLEKREAKHGRGRIGGVRRVT